MKLAALVLGLAGFSAAQLTQNPDSPSSNVVCTVVTYLNNHRDPPQSPCLVAAYLLSACDLAHAVHVDALAGRFGYPIPGGAILPKGTTLPVNKCTCSSVTYMALAGCVACQSNTAGYPPYTMNPPTQYSWTANCGTDDLLAVGEFPQDLIPQGVAVPVWAYSALTQSPDQTFPGTIDMGFNLTVVHQNITNSNLPDVTPDPVSSSTNPPASQTDTPPPAPSPASKSRTPVGAIVGGVIGGVAALALGGLAIWWFMRRTSGSRTKGTLTPATDSSWVAGHAAAPSYESGSWTASPSPPLRGVASPLPSSGLMSPANPPITKLYDPDDPTTFPPRM